ncbi:hypothetical protein ACHQM5_027498 [Ranunculus cassubicifolius]
MGAALFELEQALRSSQFKITTDEENVLNVCKGKAVREFSISAFVSSGIVWAAAAVGFGLWRFDKSLSSCVEKILGMEGSRMQKELANILLTRHRHDPIRMKLINKHFYSERVFDDSGSDRPVLRWRQRNFYSDGIAPSQKPNETDSHEDNTNNGDHTASSETKQPPERQQFPIRASGVEPSADPFENVFGNSSNPPEEILLPETGANTGMKKLTRKEKRNMRRHHRARRARALSDDDSSDAAASESREYGEASSRSGVPPRYEEHGGLQAKLLIKKRLEAMKEKEGLRTPLSM